MNALATAERPPAAETSAVEPPAEPPVLLACSHGTSSRAGQRAIAALVEAVAARRRDLAVVPSFVDVQEPDVPATLAEIGERRVRVVPLLLSAGYHVHVDLARAARRATDAAVQRALGPDVRLARRLARRLDDAGLAPDDSVVLAAAGSSDARAVADCEAMGEMLGALLDRPVRCGYISAVQPALPDAVAAAREERPGARVVVATYLLAPGYFADLATACGADVVSAPLLLPGETVAPEMVDVVLDRYDG
ncbi:sirohydrochlorin chelatase [Georgenia wangjunii]|uniref:sirohydrochlorin chelatase n=1 Tax=Georgenia wangjunii TaxID=3117730 RepID=UPI002F265119